MVSPNFHLSIVVLFSDGTIPHWGLYRKHGCVGVCLRSPALEASRLRWGLPEIFWGRGSARDCGVLGVLETICCSALPFPQGPGHPQKQFASCIVLPMDNPQ